MSFASSGRRWGIGPDLHARRAGFGRDRFGAMTMVGVFLLAGACTVIGYALARQAAERQHSATFQESPAAETRTLAAAPPALPSAVSSGTGQSRVLWLDAELGPAADAARSVFDTNGRILGWVGAGPVRDIGNSHLWIAAALALAFGIGIAAAIAAFRAMRRKLDILAARAALAEKTANEDLLTGLPHRRAMLALLDRALAQRSPDGVIALAFFNVDGFKEINDIHGHETGDQLLAALAERLKTLLPQDSKGGRVGADEFAIVIASGDRSSAAGTIERIAADLSKPYWIGGRSLAVGLSGGYALAPSDAKTREDMTARANLALRAAKRRGRGRLVAFSSGLRNEAADRRFIERELKDALGAGALEVHYQPIVAANGSGMVGIEALLRWDHPERGPIAPPDFVMIAEQCGLMGELGEFVLRRALADAARWPDLYVAVNLSPVQVRDRSLVDTVARALAESGVSPSRLLLEITEGVLMDDPEEARERLDALRALGVRLALDDFGTGFSSLSYLQRFPFDKLKVDKSFVAPLGRSANAGAMIQAIVALGRALGLTVLVEGVETEEQRVLLRLAGCDEMQGYRFARPAPPEVIDRMYDTGRLLAAGGGGRTGIVET